jgi:hypothetical protein
MAGRLHNSILATSSRKSVNEEKEFGKKKNRIHSSPRDKDGTPSLRKS